MTLLKRAVALPKENALVILCRKNSDLKSFGLSAYAYGEIKKAIANDRKLFQVANDQQTVFVNIKGEKEAPAKMIEGIRKAGALLIPFFNDYKFKTVSIADADKKDDHLLAFAEGIALGNYQFLNYKVTNKEKETNTLQQLDLVSKTLKEAAVNRLQIIVDATCTARDLVNEPANTIDAVTLAKEFQRLGKEAGFKVDVYNKSKIEAMNMGGLIAVNKGSDIPPTFTVMEYKPSRPRNKKPVVLVGKGVTYDTGGYNIKVGNGMETMKCDMAGAAAVATTMWAIAKAKLPVHVIALVPATDNRINGSAYVAGDIIKMYNGLTVEMLNTDAEGRMILADALAYGEQFNPELVMEFSTLTGAAVAAIGQYGIVCMGTADEKTKAKMKVSGNNVHERLAEFPFWDEYDELIKSDVAEIKNIGGPYAGSITAGKFLAHFVKSPMMHFDIAGPAFISAKDAYRTKGGTGVGVRFLFDFLSAYKA
ncbi:MAG: leucyl aminopeptidase [Bacteroidota bacterium]|nr:leucyl aminopeptidase [Bacteroidota bacterium]